ncbi:hypothetical protein NQ317_016709 [Molorchus minor]|uniref:U1-type domain-containing protein n=1 Tax=Molorchus minor TaxID=1323400 RepID=A0ABQ9J5N6_9CUCU|nr:hypothetical protein NQ317_016709 [Molorchus minor]
MEPPYQAHQVYFRPELVPNFICILCNMVVKSQVLKSHIETDPHKMKVLQLFEKNSNLYFCVNLQVGVYGITEKDIGDMVKEKEIKLREPRKMIVKNKEKNNKTDSDSSPPSDSKEFEHNISNLSCTSRKVVKSVSCSVCKTSIEKKINLIKKHIFQAMHIDNSKIPLVQFKYYCEICNIKIIDENTWDRHFC